MADSPFNIVTSAKPKGGGKGIIVAVIIVVFLILSVVAGVLLIRQRQNIQEKAAATLCPGAEQCPNTSNPNLLQSCHPEDTDGTTNDSNCNLAGRIETCGSSTTKYCCPVAGGAWTTNLSACATASPTATATATATAEATATATATATSTATATATATATTKATATATSSTKSATPTATSSSAQSTSRPIPQTGTDWPTLVAGGVGIFVIVAAILLAL